MDIFAFSDNYKATSKSTLPILKDIKLNSFGRPVVINGTPQFATGHEAVISWAYRALRTVRGKHPVWSRNYGCDLENLTGKNFSKGTTEAEAKRYITECLTANPYVDNVEVLSIVFDGDTLTAEIKIKSIYGEEDVLNV